MYYLLIEADEKHRIPASVRNAYQAFNDRDECIQFAKVIHRMFPYLKITLCQKLFNEDLI